MERRRRNDMADALRGGVLSDAGQAPGVQSILDYLRGQARDVTGGLMGPPGSVWAEGLNAAMAGGRSLLGGSTFDKELQAVREGREEQYPGAYSVIDALREKARNEAWGDHYTNVAMGMASPIAYHGTPHVFDQFSMSKIGTGEGAQAYGHGLYFTSEPRVAELYRAKLSPPDTARWAHGRQGPDLSNAEQGALTLVNTFRQKGGPVTKDHLRYAIMSAEDQAKQYSAQAAALRARADQLKVDALARYADPADLDRSGASASVASAQSNAENAQAFADAMTERAAILRSASPESFVHEPAGSFHEVDLPDNLLDFDKPVREQSPAIQQALADAYRRQSPSGHNPDPFLSSDAWLNLPASRAILGVGHGDPVIASNTLRATGIPGHRYKGDTSGVENYVIYDDAAIKPRGRYPTLQEWLRAKEGTQ